MIAQEDRRPVAVAPGAERRTADDAGCHSLDSRSAGGKGKLPPKQALAIVPSICEALQYAHDKGVVHRDIKPENILVDKEGRVKVADFGIAKFAVDPEEEPHLTGDAERIGTVHYMAPEQVERPREVDHRADIYALGVVFYEMLTGELPLGKFPEPSKRVEVDVRLDEVVLKALEKEPARRYQQVSEVKTRVETIASGRPAAPGDLQALAAQDEPALNARLSRTALIGAACPGLVFPGLALYLQSFDSTVPVWQGIDLGVPGVRPAALMVLAAVASSFGMTILGWVAVEQIRHSGGRLYGLPLAFFNGVFFPVLVYCIGVIALSNWVAGKIGLHEFSLLWIGATLFACIGPSAGVLRRLWLAISRPLRGGGSDRLPRQRENLLVQWALAVGVMMIVAGWASLAWVQRPQLVGRPAYSESPDGHYEARASTFYAMRVLGSDRLTYRFTVQGLDYFLRWEIPANTSVSQPLEYYSFSRRGEIGWSKDGERVFFRLAGREVTALDVRQVKLLNRRLWVSVHELHNVPGHSAWVAHDETTPHFILYYPGAMAAIVSEWSRNVVTSAWATDFALNHKEDQLVIQLSGTPSLDLPPSFSDQTPAARNGAVFSAHRGLRSGDRLVFSGPERNRAEFDLRDGRVFLLQDDGSVKQLAMEPDMLDEENLAAFGHAVSARMGRIGGAWELVSMQLGEPYNFTKDGPEAWVWTISDERFISTLSEEAWNWAYKTDASRSPAWIDIYQREPDDRGDCNDPECTAHSASAAPDSPFAIGIYKLDADTLTICLADPEDGRPTGFLLEPGLRSGFMVFKRFDGTGPRLEPPEWIRKYVPGRVLLDAVRDLAMEQGWQLGRESTRTEDGWEIVAIEVTGADGRQFEFEVSQKKGEMAQIRAKGSGAGQPSCRQLSRAVLDVFESW